MNAITTRVGNALAPSTYSEARDFAAMLANSDMVPASYKGKPGNVLIAMAWGAEIGLGPLQAIQNIAVINGRPSVWGDAALALVRGHPACQAVREGVDGEGEARHGWCEVTRRGDQPQRRTFSVADAKKASLWGKSGPWQQYPDRMLQLRARGFAIRDVFPDALRGVITVEEAQDMPADQAAPMPAAAGPTIQGRAEPAPPASDLIMLDPQGNERAAPSVEAWGRWCSVALAKLESAEAVMAWMRAMQPHMDAAPLDAAQAVRDVAAERLAKLESTAADDGWPGPDAGGVA
jgi:hypothetical protein